MFCAAWVKYTDAGLPVGRVADIIRKHYAETLDGKDKSAINAWEYAKICQEEVSEKDVEIEKLADEIERLRSNVRKFERVHNAYVEQTQAEIRQLRAVVDAADRMRATVYCQDKYPYLTFVKWDSAEAFDAKRKEMA